MFKDTHEGHTYSCSHENNNTSGICDDCLKGSKQRVEFMVKEKNIKEMVNRFLGWKLPDDFSPDCGISFNEIPNFKPIETNLFTATQAEEMIRYITKEPS